MFIERLEKILKEKNIKGAELSRILKLSNSTYTQWRKGKIPNGETLKNIADTLDISVDWLLERDNAMDPEESKLLNNYRAADDRGKRRISSLAEEEAQEQISLTSGNGETKNSII